MSIRYREFSVGEVESVSPVFVAAYNDLLLRRGEEPYVDLNDEQALAASWEKDRRSIFEHMTETGSASWLAEDDERVLAYARSLVRDGVAQLTDFFIVPHLQKKGVGKKLLEKTFESLDVEHKTIISTSNGAAMTLYLRSGVYPQGTIVEFYRRPEPVEFETDLDIERISLAPATLADLNRLDQDVLGYKREVDHRWLLGDRQGYLYLRRGKPVGYGYVGRWCGPFALDEPRDFPAILAHAETEMAKTGHDMILMVPLQNREAVDHVLRGGFHMRSSFIMFYMADTLHPRLDHYLFTMPGFFS